MSNPKIVSSHRGIFSLYNTGMAAFFTLAVVVAIILINAGFSIIDTEKTVVTSTVSKVDNHLAVAGTISGTADVSSNELTATGTPIRTASAGSVNVTLQEIGVSYELTHIQNFTLSYDDIYVGNLHDAAYNSLGDALADAKQQGLIDVNPYVDEQKPTSTTAFVYWIINQDFDQHVDRDELAVLAIVYADKDRPSSGAHILVQVNVADGYILKLERDIPNISSTIVNFGGKVRNP